MKNIKLKYLVPFIFFTISMVVSLGIYFFNIDRALKTEENKFIELAKYRAIERQGIIEALLRKDDIAELRRIFNVIGAAKDLEYALLIDENEKVIISTKRMFA
ncbi:MAG: hypothetical protein QG567_1778, partial [Campylobacterota bacterium]|nr:hypothetical protein [Campylobacterota bacterium]